MATAKPPLASQDNTGSTFLAQFPPHISPESSVLASAIALPQYPLIAYAVFSGGPSTRADNLNCIEHARRKVLMQNSGPDILDSLIPAVHISMDSSALYVFAFGSSDRTSEAQGALAALQFDDLARVESSTFQPSSVYPCSAACSTQDIPCSECLNPAHPRVGSSSAHLLPRQSLRLPFYYLLNAVRDRLIDDITEASRHARTHRPAIRYKDGFLLGPSPASSEWSAGWEHPKPSRPLIYSSLEVQLSHHCSRAQLLIHPVLRPTFYLPLCKTSPLPPGAPILLLPYGVPAYYLSTYAGPTSALTSQFQDALMGLGAGDWTGDGLSSAPRDDSRTIQSPTYVIAWLPVQNKQGEDKGMPIIWPLRLCLSYHPSSPSPHARTPLSYIPELPAQLQASPPPPVPAVPATFASGKADATSATSNSRDGTPLQGPGEPPEQGLPPATITRRAAAQRPSTTVDSVRAFRGMTLVSTPSTRSLQMVVSEVSGYVDSVAKERERERERMKREKENANIRARTNSFSGAPVALSPPQPDAEAAQHHRTAEELQPVVELGPPGRSTPAPVTDIPMEQDVDLLFLSSQESSTDSLFSPAEGVSPSSTGDAEPVIDETMVGTGPENIATPPMQLDSSIEVPQDGLATFDSFAGFGDNMNGWASSSSSDFMAVDMGLGTDFGMGTFGSSRSGAGVVGDFDMDDGLGVFTDDDFSFFDAPSVQSRASAPLVTASVDSAIKAGEGLTPTAGPAPLGFPPLRVSDGALSSGPGPPSAVFSNRSPWPQTHIPDSSTPRLLSTAADLPSPAPDLIPPSPTKSASTQSAPATPRVLIADVQDGAVQQKGRYLGIGPSIFDPISFAPGHRSADSKYVFGKFALPSPPDSEDRAENVNFSANGNWMLKYNAATDPRIGMMKKLVGVKRKGLDYARSNTVPAWMRGDEGWESTASSPGDDDEPKSDSESEDEELLVDDEGPASALRSSTPPPSYLPLGPTLLQTRFHHGRLLPLSAPLKPPGSAVDMTAGGPLPASAPTPVSPAAVLGATSEKSRSLEAAVQILVKEVVENNIWADTWRANAAASSMSLKPPYEVWQTDVERVDRLLESVKGSLSPVDLARYFSPALGDGVGDAVSLYTLEPPMLTIGKSDALVQVFPTALRFWEKLGLRPRPGSKDVTAFAFFERSDGRNEEEIGQWLSKISVIYTAKNYGMHVAGTAAMCSKAGLVPVQFDSFKKTLAKFASGLPASAETAYVFYIVTPPTIVTPDSPLLRQLFSAVKRCTKTYPDLRVLYHFVPEALPAGALADSRFNREGLEVFVGAVYDRLLQPVERPVSEQLIMHTEPTRAYFQAPAFSLACALPSRKSLRQHNPITVAFTPESRPSSLDLVNRHMLFHVGYSVTPCKRWLLAAGVDERGDSHEFGAWLLPDEAVDASIVRQVWSFARNCTARVSVEWRLAVAKLGPMGGMELNAWIHHLDSTVVNGPETLPIRVMLLTVENQRSLTFLAPLDRRRPPSSLHPTRVSSTRSPPRGSSGHVFADTATATYAVFPPARASCSPTLSFDFMSGVFPGSLDLPFIQDAEDEGPPAYERLAMRGLARSLLINVPAGTDYTSINSIEIVQLHSACSRTSTSHARYSAEDDAMVVDEGQAQCLGDMNAEDARMLRDVTHNYHALAVLAQARWQPRDAPGLPLHLSALDAMKIALTGGSAGVS
ncbi:hypothetical protein DAEQUDRAFT_729591 [Daedalea quercina L-15889]|uniref:Mediator of RNA polymerase II transcription subunit 13 n=1 Tax=Daedalea quercina L-15889 TaxID=1314783 RepID=A0A165NI06_9APHY|nr:hypothetical protein DAEQUDRAFT_729591 [Daedalea quercina L-15889]